MTLSIRNQLPGTVTTITTGEVMATIGIRLTGGQHLTAAITKESVTALALAPGSAVRALIKSTEVAVATAPMTGLSIRNQLPGTVTTIAMGAAMASVKIAFDDIELTAAITKDAAADLSLAPGTAVVALIKSTEVALATA